ncbi:MAG: lipid-A-disaccharide synthase [Planctomycetes bacterium]|nr:lipid-A-disaccharide synthase [Planctomycetota bacterium]
MPSDERGAGAAPRSGSRSPAAWLVFTQAVVEFVFGVLSPLRLVLYGLTWRRAELRRVAEALAAPAAAPPPAPVRPSAPRAGRPLTLFLSAGEASGDLHAGHLLQEIRARRASVRAVAFGGERLREAGAEIDRTIAHAAGMGLLHGWLTIPRHIGLAKRFVDLIDRERPDAVVLVDNPGFHLVLATLARRRGVPAIQYVCPQSWAWAPWRWRRMRRDLAAALAIVPFEVPYFEHYGIQVRYVGHPLGDDLTLRSIDRAEVERRRAGGPLVVLMPGSRGAEVRRNLGPMARIADAIRAEVKDARFVLAQRDRRRADQAQALLQEMGNPPALELFCGETDALLAAASLVLAKSGTGTLEVAHYGAPLVVFYRLGRRFDRWISRVLLAVPHFSMLNLLARREAVPEILAVDEADEARAARECIRLLTDPQARESQLSTLKQIRPLFDAPGAAARVAEEVLSIAERRKK